VLHREAKAMSEDKKTESIVKRAFDWALSVDAECNKEYHYCPK
jgi:hypothetical protein